MTEIELMVDLHKTLERQGPGSEADTLRALALTDISEGKNLQVADIGCGTGGQTLTLARATGAEITAVDLFPEFLEILEDNAQKEGLQDRIKTVAGSMDSLNFENASLDLIWSEGAIYNMGFERGVREWGQYLRPGGYLCVSEITWITAARPPEIEAFWNAEYPEIDRASEKIRILESSGYTLAGYFTLPDKSWTQHYYQPLEQAFEAFLERHGHSQPAMRVVASHREEIGLYQKYGDNYSYGFYIARKAQVSR